MSSRIRSRGALVLGLILTLAGAQHAHSALVPRSVLKTFFMPGDKPSAPQFATFIDSTLNFVDDRYLLGLKVYDPVLVYQIGDTVIFNRLFPGDIVGGSSSGIEFAPAAELTGADAPTLDMDTHFAGQYGFLGIQLTNAAGTEIYNGYLQLGMDARSSLPGAEPPGVHVEWIVYNDVAGEPIEIVPIPEPGTFALLGVGAILMLGRRKI